MSNFAKAHQSVEHDPSNASDTHAARVQRVLKNFQIIIKSVQRQSAMVEAHCGMGGSQLWALWELLMSPGLKVSELSRAMSIHQSTASNLLDKLERRNLVRRERRDPDQRVVRLFLTPEGLEVIHRAPPPAREVLMHALLRLSDKPLDELESGLAKVIANINTVR